MRGRRSPLRGDASQRGAASIEALVLLPFFFVAWAGLYFTYRVLERRIVVHEAARACTWAAMSGGCSEPRSPRCHFQGGAPIDDDELEGSRAAIDNLDQRVTAFELDFRGMFGPIFRDLFHAARDGRVARPPSLGSGDVAVTADFSAMCNETPGDETVAGVTRSSFCALSGWCD